jgi:hypothetical protein
MVVVQAAGAVAIVRNDPCVSPRALGFALTSLWCGQA